MKRSLLLISLICAIGFGAQAQKLVNPSAKPQSETKAKPATEAATATKSNKKKSVKHTTKKKKKVIEVKHTAPDQTKIDSIKKEKMKHKK